MSHDHSQAAALPFDEIEIEQFHNSDRHGAAAIVGLMVGIFIIGLALYTVVALCCVADRYGPTFPRLG
jgi:hypothetical protein